MFSLIYKDVLSLKQYDDLWIPQKAFCCSLQMSRMKIKSGIIIFALSRHERFFFCCWGKALRFSGLTWNDTVWRRRNKSTYCISFNKKTTRLSVAKGSDFLCCSLWRNKGKEAEWKFIDFPLKSHLMSDIQLRDIHSTLSRIAYHVSRGDGKQRKA